MKSKVCKKCQQAKPSADFYGSRNTKDGLRGKCKTCTLDECREYAADPVNVTRRRALERAANRKGRDPETVRRHRLWTWFRLTWEQYEELLASQGGVCAICKSPEPLGQGRFHVDHDHACCNGPRSCGECVRGLLCSRCNPMIGMAKDDVAILRSAVDYLAVTRKVSV